jgi:transposase
MPDNDRTLSLRSAFAQQMHGVDPARVISIDETCIYMSPRPRHGYAKRGRRLHVPLSTFQQRKFTLTMAISSKRVVHWQLIPGSANTKTFADFLTHMPITDIAEPLLLMDNVAFHKSRHVRGIMDTLGVQVAYTPPYSPEFNPIEMAFSVMKAVHRREFALSPPTTDASSASASQRMEACLAGLTGGCLSRMFGHCWALIQKMAGGRT